MTMFSKDFTIDPRRLRVLREVGLRGTVTSAASGLHLTPSAVSQQIAALSRDLGVPLLEKTGRGVRLTGQPTSRRSPTAGQGRSPSPASRLASPG
jgi:molybdenum-dependent DNA-binding transcriptional regulator ModE